jgi:hypothetical protein
VVLEPPPPPPPPHPRREIKSSDVKKFFPVLAVTGISAADIISTITALTLFMYTHGFQKFSPHHITKCSGFHNKSKGYPDWTDGSFFTCVTCITACTNKDLPVL